jgi:predicted ArsR family transcriptional regulator
MNALPWDQRFLSSTRGRIITLLRRENHTVDELAQALELTDNAVRSHLATLERDGLVEQRGVRRGGGKPAYIYSLTIEAEHLFAKAYAPVLNELLSVLAEQIGDADLKSALRTVGRRLAGSGIDSDDAEVRLRAAADALNSLGGLAETSIEDGRAVIQGYSCPLTAISATHCEICQLAEELVTEIAGFPMQENCDRGERPRCRFEGRLPNAQIEH